MTYEEIYSRFYLKETDPDLFKLSKEDAYEKMCGWLHTVASMPYVRKRFSNLTLNDELYELTFELVDSIDESDNKASDNEFVKEVFAQGMVICWMRPQIERNINLAVMLGTKEEKMMLNNYKHNVTRLEVLERDLKKFIRDYGYFNNSYIAGEL